MARRYPYIENNLFHFCFSNTTRTLRIVFFARLNTPYTIIYTDLFSLCKDVGRIRDTEGSSIERWHVHVLRGGLAERREYHQFGRHGQTALVLVDADGVPGAWLGQRVRGRERRHRALGHYIHVERQRTADHRQQRAGRCAALDQ